MDTYLTLSVVSAVLWEVENHHILGNWAAPVVDPRAFPLEPLNSYRWQCGIRNDSGRASTLKRDDVRLSRGVRYFAIPHCFSKSLPGLSALNLNTTYPLFGTAMVSLAGGKLNSLCNNPLLSRSKACFKLIFLMFLSGDRPIPITLKAYPCKWKGWLRFGCWTAMEE